jgi:voltage-gated potassium channel
VGYGDVTPITPWGKFFGGTITLLAMGMVALPAGILTSSFSEQAHQK